MRLHKLHFGTSGIPLSTEPRNTLKGIQQVKALQLDAMELEFVHSVHVKEEAAPLVKKTAEQEGVVLSCHGQYYINLHAQEKVKLHASIERVLQACRIAHQCGAYSICFHLAYYLGQQPEVVYPKVKEIMQQIIRQLQEEGVSLWVRPETTGKGTQFGTLQETLKLSQDVEQVMPCIDFSHLHARSNGKYNTTEEFHSVLEEVERALGKEGLENMHIHLSGIAYGPKGEKHHLLLEESDLQYQELVNVWKAFQIKGVVISESPNIEGDALLLKKLFYA